MADSREPLPLANAQKKAITDALTGLYNRRGILEIGEYEVQRSLRYNRSLSAILINIDHFQVVFLSHGRVFSNHIITEIGSYIRKSTRKVDLVGRTSGDEFIILLPESDLFGASVVAERLRSHIEGRRIELMNNAVDVTISMGVTKVHPGTSDIEGLLHKANEALEAAKLAGGNRVEIR
jgi:diguanylate cyclase (GGDEF)-like protein